MAPGGPSSRPGPAAPAPDRSLIGRLWPLLVLAAGFAVFLALRLDRYVGFGALKEHRAVLVSLVEGHPVAAGLGFMVVYALAAAFSLPIAAVLSISGGFLFGLWWGTALNVAGAGIGATALFQAARTAFGDSLRRRAGPWLARMEDGFRDDAFFYLLVLRLVPLFPFVAVNLVPAALGVGLRDFVLATFIGIIPGAFVYTSVGAGLGSVFDAGGEFQPAGILTPQVITALVGLACLALVPVVYKRLRRSR
ncbi:MAG: TVP38/TMEM64 family protein [Alphaproteobacteria bacterium]|nr:TVP38/TMEM64 family protein [Alphaproteobacteria bacterium]